VLAVTAGILHIGNVTFKPNSASTCEVSMDGVHGDAIRATADLWKVDEEQLKTACHCVELARVGIVARSVSQAIKLRDAMAKSVMDELFKWMVAECSAKLQTDPRYNPHQNRWIGVLDIFGFEFYEVNKLQPKTGAVLNGLDQFNINYCNEKLQGHFVDCIFKLERALYEDQIGVPIISKETLGKIDNSDTLEAIADARGRGARSVVKLLDEVAIKGRPNWDRYPNAEDMDSQFFGSLKKFMNELDKNERTKAQKDKKPVGTPRLCEAPTKGQHKYIATKMGGAFIVDHYAANVLYDVRGWYSKEVDKLSDPIENLLKSSQDNFFMKPVYSAAGSANKPTVCGDFKTKLDELIGILSTTDTNFVRCIKASNPLNAGQFTASLVLNQLRYTGMLDTLKIRRLGFPFRQSHAKFWADYHVLDPSSGFNDVDTLVATIQGRAAEIAAGVLEKTKTEVPEEQICDAVRVGRSKQGNGDLVLVRDWLARELDIERKICLGRAAVTVQSVWRASESKNIFREFKDAALALQSPARATLYRLLYYRKKWKYLVTVNRTAAVQLVRASISRQRYYKERAKLFYNEICHRTQEMIMGTIMRQRYYELKTIFMEEQMVAQERTRMRCYDSLSHNFMQEQQNERQQEAYERSLRAAEEDYAHDYKAAKEMESFMNEKEAVMLDAEEYYMRASRALHTIKQLNAEARWMDSATQRQQPTLDNATSQRCTNAMKRLGIVSDCSTILSRPALSPLPVTEGPTFKFEVEKYSDLHNKNTEGGRLVASLRGLKINKCTDRQRAFVVRFARQMDVPLKTVYHIMGVRK